MDESLSCEVRPALTRASEQPGRILFRDDGDCLIVRSERAAPLLLQCLRQSAHHSPFSALVGVVTPSKFSKSYRREQHRVAAPMAREASQRKHQNAAALLSPGAAVEGQR